MRAAISPWISYCTVDDREIILDTRANRYFSVPLGTLSLAVNALGTRSSSTSANAKALIDRGHVAASVEGVEPGRQCAHRSAQVSLDEPLLAKSPSPRLIWRAFRSLIISGAELKLRRFDALLLSIVTDAERSECTSVTPLIDVLIAYRYARRLLPGRDSCLRDSIALSRLLHTCGHRTAIVLGVALKPFSAHCWVEVDGIIVGDFYDRIAHLTPILTIP